MTADTELEELLRRGLRDLDPGVPPAAAEPLAKYLLLLDKWNRAVNLTAVRDPREMVARHVLDSLSARPFLHGLSVLDVGTGAGLPGLPLAVAEPLRQFVLLDSGGKKTRFVRHVIGELELGNVEVVHSRAENFRPADPFDTVICRAFASLRDFVRRCAGLVASGGRLVAMKASLSRAELHGVPAPWRVVTADPVGVPGVAGERHILVIERAVVSDTNSS